MLQTARIVDAAVGLIGAPLLLILLVGWAGWSWLRYGKDPVYLDDSSILMPAPPPDLTAASAAVVWEGRTVAPSTDDGDARSGQPRRAVVQAERACLGLHTKTGIQMETPPADDPAVMRNRRAADVDAEDVRARSPRGHRRHATATTSRPTTCSSSAST